MMFGLRGRGRKEKLDKGGKHPITTLYCSWSEGQITEGNPKSVSSFCCMLPRLLLTAGTLLVIADGL